MQAAKAAAKAAKDVAISTTGAFMEAATSSSEPPPPPRETWTYSTFGSGFCDPGFCCYAWWCPTCANAEIEQFMKNGNEDGEINCMQAIIAMLCPCDAMTGTRERVREHTNIVAADGCPNMICMDTCCCICMCWGCAMAQEKRELRVWYGTAGSDAPKHPGSPAIQEMNSE
jgi:Cys-rich protein (TIGR01571 family)